MFCSCSSKYYSTHRYDPQWVVPGVHISIPTADTCTHSMGMGKLQGMGAGMTSHTQGYTHAPPYFYTNINIQ